MVVAIRLDIRVPVDLMKEVPQDNIPLFFEIRSRHLKLRRVAATLQVIQRVLHDSLLQIGCGVFPDLCFPDQVVVLGVDGSRLRSNPDVNRFGEPSLGPIHDLGSNATLAVDGLFFDIW